MKKLLLAMFATLSLMLASCGDDDDDTKATIINNNSEPDDTHTDGNDIIVDYAPIVIRFQVVDKKNKFNFIDKNYNDIIHTTTLTYRGKTYSVGQTFEDGQIPKEGRTLSKAYMPFFDGLYIDNTAMDRPFFGFGELEGAENYDDDFIINFADGTADTIHFKRKFNWSQPIVDTWTLNGKEHSGGTFCLYREKNDDGSTSKPTSKEDVKQEETTTQWAPIEVKFYVVDYGQKRNYIDENYNDLIHTTTLTYRGKTYSVSQTPENEDDPVFKGFYIDSTYLKKPYFCFGGLDGAKDYDDDFVITFEDGTTETIHFKRVHQGDEVEDSWTRNGGKKTYSTTIFYRAIEDGKLVNLHLGWE